MANNEIARIAMATITSSKVKPPSLLFIVSPLREMLLVVASHDHLAGERLHLHRKMVLVVVILKIDQRGRGIPVRKEIGRRLSLFLLRLEIREGHVLEEHAGREFDGFQERRFGGHAGGFGTFFLLLPFPLLFRLLLALFLLLGLRLLLLDGDNDRLRAFL